MTGSRTSWYQLTAWQPWGYLLPVTDPARIPDADLPTAVQHIVSGLPLYEPTQQLPVIAAASHDLTDTTAQMEAIPA